jgi:hypothetical protein
MKPAPAHLPTDRLSAGALWVVLALLVFGLTVRLFDLTDPPIDFHPTRQLRGAIVARGIYYQLPGQKAPLPPGLSLDEARQKAIAFKASAGQYEPPILESLVALTYQLLGAETAWIARIYTSFFWMIGGIGLFALARRLRASPPASGKIIDLAAAAALAFYLLLPFSVQASRSFQPDPGMVMGLILTAWALDAWAAAPLHGPHPSRISPGWRWAIAAGLLGGAAIFSKAVAAYILAGAAGTMLLWRLFAGARPPAGEQTTAPTGKPAWAQTLLQAACMAFLMLAPTVIYTLLQGGRASEYFQSWTIALSHLLLQPATYLHWLDTLQGLLAGLGLSLIPGAQGLRFIEGWLVLLLALLGLLAAQGRSRALLLGLWGGYLLYGLFFPYQMYSHSYYHLAAIPICALSLAPAIQSALARLKQRSSAAAAAQTAARTGKWLVAGLACLWIGLAVVSNTRLLAEENHRGEPAYWQEIAAQLPPQGKIIALTQDYGYRLMYYGWRKVSLWPNRGEQAIMALRGSQKDFEDLFAKRTADKSYFLITSFNQFEDQPDLQAKLNQDYPLLAGGQRYLIFDLTAPIQGSP